MGNMTTILLLLLLLMAFLALLAAAAAVTWVVKRVWYAGKERPQRQLEDRC